MSTLAAWWRGRGIGHIPEPPRRIHRAREAERPVTAVEEESIGANNAEVALRQFISFALDEKRADTPGREELALLEPMIQAASAAISRLEVQAKYLPRRPSLLPRLLSAMNSDGNSMRDLAAIIKGDPTLLGNLLRVANSVFYRVSDKPVESLERAVTMVGTDGIRSVIATALVHPVMATGSGWFARFPETIWEQTQYAADAAEAYAQSVERVDGFHARMLALVHGLATNTVFRIVRDEVLTGRSEAAKPAVAKLLDQWVAPTARRIAASWDLPPELQFVLESPTDQSPLGRALFFGRLAGSQVVMVRRGRVKETSARATVLASGSQRMQMDRLWGRIAASCLQPG
ncbi:MAG TPA: HDOD domain-containing protein [Steroidobacteraceae bacterium]